MRYLLIVALVVMIIGVPCAAAEKSTETHLQAAEELLNEINIQGTLAESIDTTLNMQLQQSPELMQFEDVMRTFLHKYMSWEYLREHLVQLYADTFTEHELREIIAFYRTEVGKKVVELTPVLLSRGMALGQKAVEEHLPELEQMILDRVQELKSTN